MIATPGGWTAMSDLFAEAEEEKGVDQNGKITPSKKYDTAVKSGQATLKALLILNGGATIAFLNFMQNVLQKPAVNQHAGEFFIAAMQWFIWGTFCAVLSFGTIFITNCLSLISGNRTASVFYRASSVFFGVTLLVGLCSFGFFLYASTEAVRGFRVVGSVFFAPGRKVEPQAHSKVARTRMPVVHLLPMSLRFGSTAAVRRQSSE
jgi:hypothetical protein